MLLYFISALLIIATAYLLIFLDPDVTKVVSRAPLVAVVLAILAIPFVNSFPPPTTAPALAPIEAPVPPEPAKNMGVAPLASVNLLSRFAVYLSIAGSLIISVFLPWLCIFALGPSYPHRKPLADALFLMMSQVLFEVWSYRPKVKGGVRVAIPLAFVSYRLLLLVKWARGAAQMFEVDRSVTNGCIVALASSNVVFWFIVLVYVLILKVTVPYFSHVKRFRRQ